MPTTKKDWTLLFPAVKGISDSKAIRVFPAEQWEKWGGVEGQYRVMLGEAWEKRPSERHSFFTTDGVLEIINRTWKHALTGEPVDVRITPGLPKGACVRICDDTLQVTRTRCEPFQDEYKEWRVYVFHRSKPVLLDDLKLVEES